MENGYVTHDSRGVAICSLFWAVAFDLILLTRNRNSRYPRFILNLRVKTLNIIEGSFCCILQILHQIKPRHHSVDRGPYSQGYGLPSGHVQLWELDHKEGRAWKNWCLWTMVLEKTPESPLDNKEIKPINLKSTLNTCWKDWRWNWNSSIFVIWCKQLTHWKTSWCWERLRAAGEEGIRGWDDWMASQCNGHELG